MKELILEKVTGFQWDSGNETKNWEKHGVTKQGIEENFFNEPLTITSDKKHSLREERWYMLGQSDNERFLFIVFTIRNGLIRVISTRDMKKKERNKYEQKFQ